MSASANSVKTADVAKQFESNNLTTVTTNQTVTRTSAAAPVSKAKTEAEYMAAIYGSGGQARTPGAEPAASSSGGNDFFSGIARAITSAVNVAMTVINPLSAVANLADTVSKATNKKA